MSVNIPRKLSREKLHASWLNQLRDYAISITPHGDSKTTAVNRVPGGSTIRSILKKGGVTGNDKYEGYFKASNASDSEDQILGITFGESIINDQWFTVPSSGVIITVSGYVYFQSEYTPPVTNDFGDIVVEGIVGTPVILLSEELPVYSDLHYREIIAEVTFADSKITGFTQISHSMIIGDIFDKLTEDVLNDEEREKKLAENHCATSSDCNETSNGCKRHGDMVELEGTLEEVNSEFTTFSSNVNAKCKSLGSDDDQERFSGSCGTIYMVEALNSVDGANYTKKFFYCCCEKGTEDELTKCESCSEQNDVCEHGDCEAVESKTSTSYPDYETCIKNQTGSLSTASIEKYCSGIEEYIGACCVQVTSTCSEDASLKNFSFSFIPCCCPENEEDPIEPCTDCSEQNDSCYNSDCENTSQSFQSEGVTSEEQCLINQTESLKPTGLTAICNSLDTFDGNSTYGDGCCFKDLSACSEINDEWKYSFTACCCLNDCDALDATPVTLIEHPQADIQFSDEETKTINTFTNDYPCTVSYSFSWSVPPFTAKYLQAYISIDGGPPQNASGTWTGGITRSVPEGSTAIAYLRNLAGGDRLQLDYYYEVHISA